MGQDRRNKDDRRKDAGHRLLAPGSLYDEVGSACCTDAALLIDEHDQKAGKGQEKGSPLRPVPQSLCQSKQLDESSAAQPDHQTGDQTEEHPPGIDPEALSAESDLRPHSAEDLHPLTGRTLSDCLFPLIRHGST